MKRLQRLLVILVPLGVVGLMTYCIFRDRPVIPLAEQMPVTVERSSHGIVIDQVFQTNSGMYRTFVRCDKAILPAFYTNQLATGTQVEVVTLSQVIAPNQTGYPQKVCFITHTIE